jgi:hypothetical protein
MPELNPSAPDELDPLLTHAAAALRESKPFGQEFEDRIMAAVRLEQAPTAGSWRRRVFSIGRWATASQTVEISPLRGLAVAAGLAALLAGSVWLGRQSVALPGVAAVTNQVELRPVEFVLAAPGASQVMLVGDFNGWSPGATPLRASERRGIWSVTVPLAPGRHEYAFLVDGKHWLPDPRAPRAPGDDFGAPNSVLTVTERS